MSSTLINHLYEFYNSPKIDLLINDDTYEIAKLIPNVCSIYQFSYQRKKTSRLKQEKELFNILYRKYDLSVNLTSSDRSVIYGLLSAKTSLSAVEKEFRKSWWKKLFLSKYYYYDTNQHIHLNNLEPLKLLNINYSISQTSIKVSRKIEEEVTRKLNEKGINKFIIFHPSAQYDYKIYPEHLRNNLMSLLEKLTIQIVITGSSNVIDTEIKKKLKLSSEIFDFIGETSLEEFVALSKFSEGYIGMDTLNMHIAASQNKRIFAIFGPTNLSMWSPWSNQLNEFATKNMPIQTYGNVTIFQAAMPCVACGNAGCDDNHGKSECLYRIEPKTIFNEIENWLVNV